MGTDAPEPAPSATEGEQEAPQKTTSSVTTSPEETTAEDAKRKAEADKLKKAEADDAAQDGDPDEQLQKGLDAAGESGDKPPEDKTDAPADGEKKDESGDKPPEEPKPDAEKQPETADAGTDDDKKTMGEKVTEGMSEIGESIRNASKGMIEWVIKKSQEKGNILTDTLMSGVELLLRLMVGNGGKGMAYMKLLSPTQLDFLEVQIGMKVERDSEGKAAVDEEGKLKVEWVPPDKERITSLKLHGIFEKLKLPKEAETDITSEMTYKEFVAMVEGLPEDDKEKRPKFQKLIDAMKDIAGDKEIPGDVNVAAFVTDNFFAVMRRISAPAEETQDAVADASASKDGDSGSDDGGAEGESGADDEGGTDTAAGDAGTTDAETTSQTEQ